ncbi:MAG: hypothetical protein JWN50_350 [Parcubacteria group bacterium]|nr:hypothetical protein [Parcubacteria group bacterium]
MTTEGSTTQSLRGALLAYGQTAEAYQAAVERREAELAEAQENRRRMLKNHTKEWVSLLSMELAERALTWCTMCGGVTPASTAKIIFIAETRKESGGYEGGDWCWNSRNALHRTCPTCREKAQKRHGWLGEKSWDGSVQERYFVYSIEERGGGLFKSHGERLPDWYELPAIIPRTERSLAIACEMPPSFALNGDELVITTYEKPAEVAGSEALV